MQFYESFAKFTEEVALVLATSLTIISFHYLRNCGIVLCSDFSWNQCWRREEASGRRDLHVQRFDDAYEEGRTIFTSNSIYPESDMVIVTRILYVST